MTLTMQIVAKTLFNADVNKESEDVSDAMEIVMQEFKQLREAILSSGINPTPGKIRFRKATRKFDNLIYNIIRIRRDNNEDTKIYFPCY